MEHTQTKDVIVVHNIENGSESTVGEEELNWIQNDKELQSNVRKYGLKPIKFAKVTLYYELLRPFFGWLPIDIIKHKFKNTNWQEKLTQCQNISFMFPSNSGGPLCQFLKMLITRPICKKNGSQ